MKPVLTPTRPLMSSGTSWKTMRHVALRYCDGKKLPVCSPCFSSENNAGPHNNPVGNRQTASCFHKHRKSRPKLTFCAVAAENVSLGKQFSFFFALTASRLVLRDQKPAEMVVTRSILELRFHLRFEFRIQGFRIQVRKTENFVIPYKMLEVSQFPGFRACRVHSLQPLHQNSFCEDLSLNIVEQTYRKRKHV